MSMVTTEAKDGVGGPHLIPHVAWVLEEHSRALSEISGRIVRVCSDLNCHRYQNLGAITLSFSQPLLFSASSSHSGLVHTCPAHLGLASVPVLAFPYLDCLRPGRPVPDNTSSNGDLSPGLGPTAVLPSPKQTP